MGIVLCINRCDELIVVDDKGQIGRIARDSYKFTVMPSSAWRIAEAVEYNNFGREVRRWDKDAVLAHPEDIPWRWKNGAQRTFIRDYDHGALREWRNPGYVVYRPNAEFIKTLDGKLEQQRAQFGQLQGAGRSG